MGGTALSIGQQFPNQTTLVHWGCPTWTNLGERCACDGYGLWQDWVDDSKPWAGGELPCKPADRLFFNASTIVTVGNRAKAQF